VGDGVHLRLRPGPARPAWPSPGVGYVLCGDNSSAGALSLATRAVPPPPPPHRSSLPKKTTTAPPSPTSLLSSWREGLTPTPWPGSGRCRRSRLVRQGEGKRRGHARSLRRASRARSGGSLQGQSPPSGTAPAAGPPRQPINRPTGLGAEDAGLFERGFACRPRPPGRPFGGRAWPSASSLDALPTLPTLSALLTSFSLLSPLLPLPSLSQHVPHRPAHRQPHQVGHHQDVSCCFYGERVCVCGGGGAQARSPNT